MVEGQTDVVTMGLPYIGPYNVKSILNPVLVACLALTFLFGPAGWLMYMVMRTAYRPA